MDSALDDGEPAVDLLYVAATVVPAILSYRIRQSESALPSNHVRQSASVKVLCDEGGRLMQPRCCVPVGCDVRPVDVVGP